MLRRQNEPMRKSSYKTIYEKEMCAFSCSISALPALILTLTMILLFIFSERILPENILSLLYIILGQLSLVLIIATTKIRDVETASLWLIIITVYAITDKKRTDISMIEIIDVIAFIIILFRITMHIWRWKWEKKRAPLQNTEG